MKTTSAAVTIAALLPLGCGSAPAPQAEPEVNRPPRLLFGTLSVNGIHHGAEASVQVGADCPNITFEAAVEDENVGDRIRSQWFVDYDPSGAAENRRPFETGVVEPTGEVIRQLKPLTIAPGSVDNPLEHAGSHVILLIVSDGVLEIGDAPGTVPPPEPQDGVDGGSPRYIDHHAWFVTVDTAPCVAGGGQ